MNVVLYTHPAFLGLTSQDRFAQMLLQGLQQRGHTVTLRRPSARLRARWPAGRLAKWAGYADQYLLFPAELRRCLASDPPDTLQVLCDQALGPWMPLLAGRPHVVHCHDMLALRSALGEIAEHRTGFSGRLYQRWIRRGLRHARHFISISEHTRDDLHRLAGVNPLSSAVVHNGMNHPYAPLDAATRNQRLQQAGLGWAEEGFLLHVGGGQWYKNAVGVVMLYGSYARTVQAAGGAPLPLLMVSPPPDTALRSALASLPARSRVHFQPGVDAATLQALYGAAQALLFPSLAEGFGWPIAEALACGCPVLTTGEPPMTEVGGDFAAYLPRLQAESGYAWAEAGAAQLLRLLDRPATLREQAAAAGRAWAARYDSARVIDRYVAIYRQVLAQQVAPQGMVPA